MEKESIREEANLKHAEKNLEGKVGEDTNNLSKPKPENGNVPELEKEPSFSSSSSSSDASSDDDFFQLDPADLNRSIAEKDRVSDKESAQSEVQIIGLSMKDDSATSTPGSDNLVALGAKQSPQIQSMGRLDCPDHSRIPSSIFRSKSTNPVEWSVASNESLFSIHIERSGDLTNYYHLDFSPIAPLVVTNSPQGPISEPDLKQPGAAEAANAEAMKDVLRAAADGHNGKCKPAVVDIRHSDSTSGLSDGSVRSFAFPILTGEGRNGSMKGDSVRRPTKEEQMQDPPLQKQPSKALPDAAEQSWFSCLSCCPFCR